MHRQFNLAYLQQILHVSPYLYNHKWEMKYDKYELVFLIPSNTIEVIEEQEAPSQQPYQKLIPGSVILKRSQFFKHQLAEIMLNHFEDYRSQTPQLSNFFIENVHRWPNMFDINDEQLIKPLPLAQLIDHPKEKTGVSMNDFLKKYDTQKDLNEVIKTAQEKDRVLKEAEMANYKAQSSNSDIDSSEQERERGEQFNVKHGISDATLHAI